MPALLIFVLLIGGYFALRWFIAWSVGKGVNVAGDALGRAVAGRTAKAGPAPASDWVVTSAKPGRQIQNELQAQGLLVDGNRVETPSGVSVELAVVPGVHGLACRWDAFAGEKGTAIVADVLRIVREVDPEAQVVI